MSGGVAELKTISDFLKGVFRKMFDFLKPFFKKKNPETLKGLLSREEFLRFDIVRKEMILEIAKVRLADFLKKGKK